MIRSAVAYIVLLFIIGVALVVTFVIWDNMDDAIQAQDAFNSSNKALFTEQKNSFKSVWDYTFLTIFVSAVVGVLLLAWAVRSNPALYFALLIVVVLLAGLSGYLSNAFETITEDTTLGNSAANFPIMSHILDNYLFYMLGMMFLMLIVFFAKPNEGAYL